MKVIFKGIAISSLLVLGLANAATEGVEYQVLPESAQFEAKNKVVKIYSINCPFCYKYDKAGIPNESLLPSGMELEQYHITTKPPFGLEKATTLAVAQVQGEREFKSLKAAFYKKYHDEKSKFSSSDEVIEFALNNLGVSQSEFDAIASTSEVKALLETWDKGVAVAKIQGIPAITVNGKYLINTKEIQSMSMLKDLIAELSKK